MLDTILDMVMVFDAVCFTVLIADEIRWFLVMSSTVIG
jgi:hypothetical protein